MAQNRGGREPGVESAAKAASLRLSGSAAAALPFHFSSRRHCLASPRLLTAFRPRPLSRRRAPQPHLPAAMERAGGEAGAPTPPAAAAAGGGVAKAKSCKGCLYYSSALRSRARGPVCVGITRTFPKVSERLIGQIELDALEEGRNLSDFKYGCVGHSIYLEDKETSMGMREKKVHAQLPACIGFELLADRKASTDPATPAYHKKETPAAPTYHKKEAPQPHQHKPGPPQPHQRKPGQARDDFLAKFQRNARLVANGVAKNMNKVGTYIKDTVGDMMDKRPK